MSNSIKAIHLVVSRKYRNFLLRIFYPIANFETTNIELLLHSLILIHKSSVFQLML